MRATIICISLLLLCGCVENPPTGNPFSDCMQPPPGCSGATFHFEQGVSNYFSPIYNPNNPDEFMYIRKRYSLGFNYTMSLEKYNLSSGTNTVIMDSVVAASNRFNSFNWGTTGWIVFEATPQTQIFKAQENGQNVTQLTSSGF